MSQTGHEGDRIASGCVHTCTQCCCLVIRPFKADVNTSCGGLSLTIELIKVICRLHCPMNRSLVYSFYSPGVFRTIRIPPRWDPLLLLLFLSINFLFSHLKTQTVVSTGSVIWVFLQLVAASLNDTCQMPLWALRNHISVALSNHSSNGRLPAVVAALRVTILLLGLGICQFVV